MADYYSLLARKIGALPQSTPQSRQAIYELARKALFNQLRAIRPPVSEQAILKEGRALDEAIARIEMETSAATQEEAPPAAEEKPREENHAALREQQRPAAPLPSAPDAASRSRRLIGIAGVCLLLVGLVAVAAWRLRERPEDLAKLRPPDQTATNEANDSAKIANRVGGAGKTAEGSENEAPAAPVARKAALYVASLQQPDKVERQYDGSVIWRLENIGGGDGERVNPAIRGDVDFPEAKVKLTLLVQKNEDSTLSASHMLKLSFKMAPDSPVKNIKEIGLVQVRRPDASTGERLDGVSVPITENNFFVGLARGDGEKRNAALLRTPAFIDVPLKLADGRLATITLEKGPSGERAFSDAFDAWSR